MVLDGSKNFDLLLQRVQTVVRESHPDSSSPCIQSIESTSNPHSPSKLKRIETPPSFLIPSSLSEEIHSKLNSQQNFSSDSDIHYFEEALDDNGLNRRGEEEGIVPRIFLP